MARGRMIDKVIVLSRKINTVSEGAENLYYRINVHADDYGHYYAEARILKGQIYPLRKISIKEITKRIQELFDINLIKLYIIDSELYLEIIGFNEHQSFKSDRPKKAEFPHPEEYLYPDGFQLAPNGSLSKDKLSKDKLSKDKITSSNNSTPPLPEKIIKYFNQRTGQNRSLKNQETLKLINGRMADGWKFEAFVEVINKKFKQWKDDPKMKIYIRPSTLFRPGNFEDYLNEPEILTEQEKLELHKKKIAEQSKRKMEEKPGEYD